MALNLDETINYCEQYTSEHEIFDNSTCPYKELGREDGEWKDTCRLPSNIPKGSSWGDCNKSNCPWFTEDNKNAAIHREIIKYLRELKQLRNEWIPCKDNLPDKDDEYLVTIDHGDGDTVECMMFINGVWFGSGKVKAWRPKPTAYKEKNND